MCEVEAILLFFLVTCVIIGQLLLTLSSDSLFLRSIVLKCNSCIALALSLVLVLKSSMSLLELDHVIKLF